MAQVEERKKNNEGKRPRLSGCGSQSTKQRGNAEEEVTWARKVFPLEGVRETTKWTKTNIAMTGGTIEH